MTRDYVEIYRRLGRARRSVKCRRLRLMSADPHRHEADEVAQPFYIAAHDSLVDEPPRTLKHGDTFALFDHYGDLASRRGNTLGLYHCDTRFLSRLKLTIEQRSPLLLSSTVRTNNAVLDVDLTNPGHPAWRDAGARQGHRPPVAHEVPVECHVL